MKFVMSTKEPPFDRKFGWRISATSSTAIMIDATQLISSEHANQMSIPLTLTLGALGCDALRVLLFAISIKDE